jgi:hypothetical protein
VDRVDKLWGFTVYWWVVYWTVQVCCGFVTVYLWVD